MTARHAHRWVLVLVLLAILLVAGHAIVLRYASGRLAFSAMTLAAVAAIVVAKFFALRRWHRASRRQGRMPR